MLAELGPGFVPHSLPRLSCGVGLWCVVGSQGFCAYLASFGCVNR